MFSNDQKHSEKHSVLNYKSKNIYRSSNCLCHNCNISQQLKIEKLSKFQPQKEVCFCCLKNKLE